MARYIGTAAGKILVPDTGTVTRALDNGQWWDVHLRPVLNTARVGGMALDLGAHVGWFSRYLALRHGVIACEPWPETFTLLVGNTLGPDRPGGPIMTWPLAAYREPVLLSADPLNDLTDPGSFAFIGEGIGPYVVGVRLDDYLDCAPINVIKADCQGADLQALRGLSRTIAYCRPLIVFEWEEAQALRQGDTWDDYERFFKERNYTVTRISESFWDYVARPL
jgi:FkbM family methyltransferase